MLCIRSTTDNPAFNIACEEYLLKNKNEECFYLYINKPSIIVGKHQNTLAEINLDYVRAQNIDVIRRLSGGGAVFHDPGNLNFSFIMQEDQNASSGFRKYTQPILDVLNDLGINARFEGRNDLTISGKKFSGNAKHTHKNKILQHGTLLFSSKLPDLSQALKVNPLKFQDKAIKSVRNRVTNISEHLKEDISLLNFEEKIINHVRNLYTDSELYELTTQDISAINQLVEEKYGTWEWNFGSSPEYGFQKGIKTKGGHIEIHLDVKEGLIQNAKLSGDFFNIKDINDLERLLVGCPHEYQHIKRKFEEIDFKNYMINVELKELLAGMF